MAVKSRRDMTVLRHSRLRKAIRGLAERPRLSVYRSETHIYAQVIDDTIGKTLVSASSLQDKAAGAPVETAKQVGAEVAKRALAAGITKVVFDRGGYKYHGRVKALADAAREAGLEF
jgi:large subunit ribosomal protein L18